MPAADLPCEVAEVASMSTEDAIQACATAARRRANRLRGIADVGQLLVDPSTAPAPRSDRERRAQAQAERMQRDNNGSWPGRG